MGAQTFDFTSTQAAGCAQGALAAGKSGNRVNRVIGATTYSSCFNHADRLVSTTEPGFTGTIAYDTHGNMTTVAGETRSYDIADRHTSTTKGAVTVTYVRDVTDRIVARTDSTGTTRFGFTAGGDNAGLTLTSANVLVERTMGLPGGVMLTTRSSGNAWSYPNWHGDHVATANQAGAKQGGTVSYDPFGNLTSGTAVDNSAGSFDYGWHGQAQRPLDTTAGLTPTIEMGARQYLPQLGRFIEQDPIEGGVDNDYTYVTDPINGSDLTGLCGWTDPFGCVKKAASAAKKAVKKTVSFVKEHRDSIALGLTVLSFVGCAVCGVGAAALGAWSTYDSCRGGDRVGCGVGIASLALGGAGSLLGKGGRLARVAGDARVASSRWHPVQRLITGPSLQGLGGGMLRTSRFANGGSAAGTAYSACAAEGPC